MKIILQAEIVAKTIVSMKVLKEIHRGFLTFTVESLKQGKAGVAAPVAGIPQVKDFQEAVCTIHRACFILNEGELCEEILQKYGELVDYEVPENETEEIAKLETSDFKEEIRKGAKSWMDLMKRMVPEVDFEELFRVMPEGVEAMADYMANALTKATEERDRLEEEIRIKAAEVEKEKARLEEAKRHVKTEQVKEEKKFPWTPVLLGLGAGLVVGAVTEFAYQASDRRKERKEMQRDLYILTLVK